MTEPEILKTLELLEKEEFQPETNLELPLPASGGEDYLQILHDLQIALEDEPDAPEADFANQQNLLELEAAAEIEAELDLLPEIASVDFAANQTDEHSDFELQLHEEIPHPAKTLAPVENVEALNEDLNLTENEIESFSPQQTSVLKPSESTDLEMPFSDDFAAPETPPTFFDSFAELSAIQPEPDFDAEQNFDDEQDLFPLEDFLAAQLFGNAQTSEVEQSEDFPSKSLEAAEDQTGFAFVPSDEENEFPEILTDEEQVEDFPSEVLLTEEPALETELFVVNAAPELTEEFQPEDFHQDFSDFLPDETREFLSELDESQFETAETSFELLPEAVEPAEERAQFVVFKVDEEYFAFPSASVIEIAYLPQLSALPFVPAWFSGITNLRGDVIAVLDLRGLWEKSATAPGLRQKMLVVRSEKENLIVGLMVDAVSEMRSLATSEINSADEFSNQPFAFCQQGASLIEDKPLHILDVEQLLASPKLRRL